MVKRTSDDLRADPGERPARQASRRASSERKPPKRGKAGHPWLRFLLRWSLVAGLWAVIAVALVLGYFALTLPQTGDLAVAERRPSVTLLAEDGSLLATFGDLFGEPVHLKELPRYLPQAVIATEDRRFYQPFRHRSHRPLARRLRRSAGRPRGAGRQHHHPAARQEPVPDARPHHLAQDPGDACWRCGSSTNSPRTRSSRST